MFGPSQTAKRENPTNTGTIFKDDGGDLQTEALLTQGGGIACHPAVQLRPRTASTLKLWNKAVLENHPGPFIFIFFKCQCLHSTPEQLNLSPWVRRGLGIFSNPQPTVRNSQVWKTLLQGLPSGFLLPAVPLPKETPRNCAHLGPMTPHTRP